MGGMGGMSGGMGSGAMYTSMGQMTPNSPDRYRSASGGDPTGTSIDAGQLGLEGMPSAPTGLPPLPTLRDWTNPTNSQGGAH